jgi:hypothetical protein
LNVVELPTVTLALATFMQAWAPPKAATVITLPVTSPCALPVVSVTVWFAALNVQELFWNVPGA